jgi:hypothetical protein
MIEANPHGAFTVDEICQRIYPTKLVEKKQAVAVCRALRRTKLPGTWITKVLSHAAGTCCLYDKCDDESQLRAHYADYAKSWVRSCYDFEGWKEAERFALTRDLTLRFAAEAREYRDASPIKKIEIEIERKKKFIGAFGDTGGQIAERIAALEVERDRLAAAEQPPAA